MSARRASAQLSQDLTSTARTDLKPDLIRLAESYLQRFLGWFFHLFLQTFNELQDALLAISPLRRLVAFALAPRCGPTVQAQIQDGSNLLGFDKLQYYVSTDAKELLLHAGLHALIAPAQGKGIPSIGRILLQCDGEGNSKYSEAVAAALAHELEASFLIVEDTLRSSIALDLLGRRLSSSEALDSSLWAYLLSFWLSGGKVAFVWDVLQRVCCKPDKKALVVLIKDAERTLCETHESFDAFTDSFGKLDLNPFRATGSGKRKELPGRRVILIAAAKLEDPKSKSSGNSLRNALEKMTQDSKRGGSGADDLASLLFPELSLMVTEDKPNPKRMLEKLFMTHVRLKLPAGSPAAERHRQKLAEDAADQREAQNKSELTLLGVNTSCLDTLWPLLRPEQLTFQEWSKVVTWARSMEAMIQTRNTLEAKKASNLTDEEMLARLSDRAAKAGPSMRRSTSTLDSDNVSMEDMTPLPELTSQKKTRVPATPFYSGFLLSEKSLAYGLRMLKVSKGKSTASVKADNTYEKNLLKEVISPEDAGNGFAEVGALGPVKDVLREVVQFPLQYPDLFAQGSLATLSRGVLLFGPPGTGKTMLARAVAAECGASFLAIHPSAVASKWLGDGVRYVKAAFSLAQKMAPCVIFLDEVDALLSRRNSHHEHEALREMKNEAMAQWDGIRQSKGAGDRVIVLGATNRPQDLDDAVLRRFSRRIFCDLPDRKAREAILKVILAKERLSEDVDLGKIAGRTDGYTGSDLRQVCTNAAMRPVKDLLKLTGREARLQEAKQLENKPAETAASVPAQKPSPDASASSTRESSAQGVLAVHASTTEPGTEQTQDPTAGQSRHTTGSIAEPVRATQLDQAADSASLTRKTSASAVCGGDSAGQDTEGSIPMETSSLPGSAPQEAKVLQAVCQHCQSSLSELGSKSEAQASHRKAMQGIMNRLLDDCDRMASSAKRMRHVELRAISAEDFEEAIKQTSPSTDKDSYSMDELRTWNATYGEGKDKGYRNPKLTYFI